MATWIDDTGQSLRYVHTLDQCAGEPCPIHSPSDHPYGHLPRRWAGGMYRVLRPYVLVPDPDCQIVRRRGENVLVIAPYLSWGGSHR